PDYPVESVSWDVIRGGDWPSGSPSSGGFIGLLCSKTGLSVDLPTEAQWEYACRAGTTEALNNGKNQSGRKRDQASDEVGNYGINWRSFSPEPVGIRLPNAWGLYDMHGNEAEWCLDWYGEYVVAPATDPVGPSSGVERVNRSGAWSFTVECLRSASRIASNSSWAFDFIGFRIAVND
ncbi:MAG: formylglycine-generating enzyme family protein, partial [Planctomycetota bacterium]